MSIGGHGDEKVRIVVSESSESRQHSENFMGCTVVPFHSPLVSALKGVRQLMNLLIVNMISTDLKPVTCNVQF